MQTDKGKMKKYLIALLAISFFLASCATETTAQPEPAPTVTVTAYPEVEDTVEPSPSGNENEDYYLSGDDIYIDIIREENRNSLTDGFSDKELFQLGKDFCDYLDAGGTVNEFISDAVYEFYDDDDALFLLATISGVAIAYYCPEYDYQLE
jgi:hypothetical protein